MWILGLKGLKLLKQDQVVTNGYIEITFIKTTNHMGGEDFQKGSKEFFG